MVDRDGVLVVNKSSYAWSIDDVMFLDAGVEAIKVLAACRFGIVIVTSQSAVGPRRMTDRIVFVGENETPRGTTGGLEG